MPTDLNGTCGRKANLALRARFPGWRPWNSTWIGTWIGWLWIAAAAGIAIAQTAPAPGAQQAPSAEALAAAQATAAQAEKDWFALAVALDPKLAPMLPCDAAARKAIQDLSRASEARITALGGYLRLEGAQAASYTENARRLLQAEEARAPEAAEERTDASLERAAIEAQVASLSTSSRPGLGGAKNALGQINDLAVQRSSLVDQHASQRDQGLAALRGLVSAYQAREAALKLEIDAFQTESTRWNTYYTLRLSRAQAECTATGGGAATTSSPAPTRRAGKGKKKP